MNNEQKPIYKKWWFWLIIFAIFIGYASNNDTTDTSNTNYNQTSEYGNTSNSSVSNKKEKFTLSSDRGYYDDMGWSYYIEGTIKNNTNKEYSYVQVEFNLYDSSGAQVGSALDNINNLEANGTWKFKAISLGGDSSNITRYKLKEISGW